MDDREFETRAEALLARLEAALEASPADLDWERVGSGILEIEFGDGSKMVINRHGVGQEMWVAARSGGFHFRWDGGRWIDTRDGAPLLDRVSELLSAQAGETIRL
ncbi:MAG TPA: iron donor protein CyaY [Rhodocyclaceae bacterium]|jgi:CyaY protein|nr:iron donor protein CyaY [Betaproteobacteria bacterium]HMV00603.1 iron donor protein CyaY [Rhodocyclaceae bacterium]HMV21309.1 iron donor protein CyaY [Rhodocyclaceae bacterium]HMW76183.1 iron donor protein CyaY [Rhodocyclaceae bacterium]HNE42486.1 iron donor protein CyaY [Rhodocyclaceae bacterium]